MVHISDPVSPADHPAFQCFRNIATAVAQNTQAYLVGQIQSRAIVFQYIHHTKTLLVVAEGLTQTGCQRILTGVTKRGMAQIMAQGDGLSKILV